MNKNPHQLALEQILQGAAPTYEELLELSAKLILGTRLKASILNNSESKKLSSGFRSMVEAKLLDVASDAISTKQREAARARVENDERQKDKQFVFQCWIAWQQNPSRYRSKSAFARDMIEKAEKLVSEKVITDWCRGWEKLEPSRISEQSAG